MGNAKRKQAIVNFPKPPATDADSVLCDRAAEQILEWQPEPGETGNPVRGIRNGIFGGLAIWGLILLLIQLI